MRIDIVCATALGTEGLDAVRRARLLAAGAAGTEIVLRVPAGAPPMIVTEAENAAAVPGVLGEIAAAVREGTDAVVVNCTADTGVAAARAAAVRVPVVGPSETALAAVARRGGRFSVLTFDARIAPRFRAMAHRAGVADRLASVRSVEQPLTEIADFEDLAAALAAAAVACVEVDGAEAVVLGCTDFENAAEPLAARLATRCPAIPILEPFRLALARAERLAALRATAGAAARS